jgi:hypothetical protein
MDMLHEVVKAKELPPKKQGSILSKCNLFLIDCFGYISTRFGIRNTLCSNNFLDTNACDRMTNQRAAHDGVFLNLSVLSSKTYQVRNLIQGYFSNFANVSRLDSQNCFE